MNLLFFSEMSPFLPVRVGGAEMSMRLIAEGLAARGHRVTFASLRPDHRLRPERIERDGMTVLLLPSPRRALGVRACQRLRLPALARALARRRWDRAAAALFGGRRFDLLYAFYETDFLARALAYREETGMAIVMRMAGLGWYDRIRREPAALPEIAGTFGGVDAINYLSEASRALVGRRAAEVGLAIERPAAFVADIGVDVARVPQSWSGPSAGPGLVLLVATRFSIYQKRQDLLVAAIARLKGRLDVRVTMIGDGPMRAAVSRLRDELGLRETIEIVPHMDQAALWERMRAADLLCHPCEHEGVSKIILEAMMLGLPVLASDVAPLPDYVIEGETGFRVANDPEAWAAKLAALAAAKAALPALSARARAFVEERYDARRNIDVYETAFGHLASRQGAAGPGAAGLGAAGRDSAGRGVSRRDGGTGAPQ